MVVRVEHPRQDAAAGISEKVAAEIRSHCEVRATVEVVAPNTLPKTEFKAKRVHDERLPQSLPGGMHA
jgi:phenylacetate-coenzyme A ligase PaaK-like adenylate-forming protein